MSVLPGNKPSISRHRLRDRLLATVKEISSPHKVFFPHGRAAVDHNCRSFPRSSTSELDPYHLYRSAVDKTLPDPLYNFAVQLGCLGFDIDMSQAPFFDMPVKVHLKIMPSVRSDGPDPEGKRLGHVVQELDRTLLVMFGIDLEYPHSRRIIDGSVLVPSHGPSLSIFHLRKLHIDLNLVFGNRFGIPLSVQSTSGRCLGQSLYSMRFQDSAHTRF
jgi:hypothetical protein